MNERRSLIPSFLPSFCLPVWRQIQQQLGVGGGPLIDRRTTCRAPRLSVLLSAGQTLVLIFIVLLPHANWPKTEDVRDEFPTDSLISWALKASQLGIRLPIPRILVQ